MMIRTPYGQRDISPSDLTNVMPHRKEGDSVYCTIILETGEHITGLMRAEDLETLPLARDRVRPPTV